MLGILARSREYPSSIHGISFHLYAHFHTLTRTLTHSHSSIYFCTHSPHRATRRAGSSPSGPHPPGPRGAPQRRWRRSPRSRPSLHGKTGGAQTRQCGAIHTTPQYRSLYLWSKLVTRTKFLLQWYWMFNTGVCSIGKLSDDFAFISLSNMVEFLLESASES